MKILIVGGGIAGVTLANFLQQERQWKVTLVERGKEWRNIGYAIGLYGNGQQALEELGLYEQSKSFLFPIAYNRISNAHGRLLSRKSSESWRFRGKPVASCYREDLHELLTRNLKDVDVRFGLAPNKTVATPLGTQVTFTDGITEDFDVVVGADGMRSWVRDNAVEAGRLGSYGRKIWVGWVATDAATTRDNIQILGDRGRMMYMVPTLRKSAAFFIAAEEPNRSGSPISSIDFLRREFGGSPDTLDIINSLEEPEKIFVDDLAYVRLGLWYKDRVVLIGDAMHGISPVLGLGVSLALEDAYVLAGALKKVVQNKDIDPALREFASARNPKISRLKRNTYLLEQLYINRSQAGAIFRGILFSKVGKRLRDTLSFLTASDPMRWLFPDPF